MRISGAGQLVGLAADKKSAIWSALVTAYFLERIFEVISAIGGGKDHAWAGEFWDAGVVPFRCRCRCKCLCRADRFVGERVEDLRRPGLRHDERSTPTPNHGHRDRVSAIVDTIWRLNSYHAAVVTPIGVVAVIHRHCQLSPSARRDILGGKLVYDYGFNVETAGDSPVWHKSETERSPADHSTLDGLQEHHRHTNWQS